MNNTFAPADIVIYNVKNKTRVSEPSLVAYDTRTFKVLAVGSEAAKMPCNDNQGRMSPFHLGEVIDFNAAAALVKLLFKREFAGRLMKPVLALCLPEFRNAVVSKAYEELFLTAGARRVDIFYDVTLDEFIKRSSEEELSKYAGIIWITKENLKEYADELIAETYAKLRRWGISKEQVISILQGMED